LPSLDDKNEMHYTQAFLLEAMRFASLVPNSVFQCSVKDFEYKGYKIPKDTMLISSLYHVMHDPENFKDPESFIPERFLNQEGNFVKDEKVVPFGIGKR